MNLRQLPSQEVMSRSAGAMSIERLKGDWSNLRSVRRTLESTLVAGNMWSVIMRDDYDEWLIAEFDEARTQVETSNEKRVQLLRIQREAAEQTAENAELKDEAREVATRMPATPFRTPAKSRIAGRATTPPPRAQLASRPAQADQEQGRPQSQQERQQPQPTTIEQLAEFETKFSCREQFRDRNTKAWLLIWDYIAYHREQVRRELGKRDMTARDLYCWLEKKDVIQFDDGGQYLAAVVNDKVGPDGVYRLALRIRDNAGLYYECTGKDIAISELLASYRRALKTANPPGKYAGFMNDLYEVEDKVKSWEDVLHLAEDWSRCYREDEARVVVPHEQVQYAQDNVCRDWVKGRCWRKNCRWLHPAQYSQQSQQPQRQQQRQSHPPPQPQQQQQQQRQPNGNGKGGRGRGGKGGRRGGHKQQHRVNVAERVEAGVAKESAMVAEESAMVAEVSAISQAVWTDKKILLDTGCTTHTGPVDATILTPTTQTITVYGGAKVTPLGTTTLSVPVARGDLTLDDVLVVPNSAHMLVSVAKLCDQGLVITFDKEGATVVDKRGETFATGSRSGNLYALDVVQHAALSMAGADLVTWHQRFCHISATSIKEMHKTGAVDGLKLSTQNFDVCDGCVRGKARKGTLTPNRAQPHQHAINKKVCFRIYTDACGPLRTRSIRGYVYFVVVVDEYSGKMWVFPVKNLESATMITVFTAFFARVRAEIEREVATLHCDNATSFNEEFTRFCAREGVHVTHTTPDNSQQNPHAERANLTLLNLVRAVLCATAVPTYLWCYLIQAICTCLNKTIPFQGKHGKKTRDELYDGIRPNVAHLRAIGCAAYGRNRSADDMKSGKLHDRATAGILVGYEESHRAKAYLVYHWQTRTVKQYRVEDVSFMENMLPCRVGRVPALLPNLPDEVLPPPQPHAVEEQDLTVHLPGDHVVYLPIEEEEEEKYHSPPDVEHERDRDPGQDQPVQSHAKQEEHPAAAREQPEQKPHTKRERPKRERKQARSSTATPSARSFTHSAPVHGGDGDEAIVNDREMAELDEDIALEANQEDIQAPTSFSQIKGRPDAQLWYNAMEEELQNMELMKVWHEVQREDVERGAEIISSQWVFTTKRDVDSSIIRKARLVACGNQELFTNMSSFSPTSRPQTFRLLLSIAAKRGLKLEQWDVKSAYLEAKLDQQVFLRPPPGVNTAPDALLKLERALYGLKRAGRLWNQTLHAEFMKLGFTQSQHDPCLYFKDGIFILAYVDDIISAHPEGSAEFKRIRDALFKRFRMKELQPRLFLGVEIKRTEQEIFITQEGYARQILQRHGYLNVNEKPTPIVSSINLPFNEGFGQKSFPYRQLIGELFYLITYTRPDLAQAVGYLARFASNPAEQHWKALTHVLRYLRKTMAYGLSFKKENDHTLTAYSDSDFAGDRVDYKSTSGFLAMLGQSVIDYGSVKQKTVARSSCEAEYVAAGSAATRVIALRSILLEIGVLKNNPTTIRMDSQSAIQLALKEGYSGRVRHIGVQHHFLRDIVNVGLIQLEWVSTTEMLADIFTKGLDPRRFERIRDFLMRDVSTTFMGGC